MSLSLHTLPVELVYRIFDHLKEKALFLSYFNVCTRLNDAMNTYHRYQTLATLDLSSNEIGHQETEHLANALRQNQVTRLTLYSTSHSTIYSLFPTDADHTSSLFNQIGDQGAKHLANALQQNQALTALYLSYNRISYDVQRRIHEILQTSRKSN